MVETNGEKKPRSSKSKRSSRRVPKSVRWHKHLTSTPNNHGMNKLSWNFNCTEKLSSILMCQKGYASLAFYALFALFILAFIYALWKIVSANTSRSSQNRRPETSSKVNPTSKAPTWSEEDEEELRKFFPTSNDVAPQKIVKSTSLPSTTNNPTTLPMPQQDFPTQPEVQAPRRLEGSLFGEDVVAPPYESNRQSPIIGEDYISPQWSPPPPTWQQMFGRQRPWSLKQRKPPVSLFRDDGMPGRYFNGRGRLEFGQTDGNIAMTNGDFRPHLKKTPFLNGDEYSDKVNKHSNTAKGHKIKNLKKIIQHHDAHPSHRHHMHQSHHASSSHHHPMHHHSNKNKHLHNELSRNKEEALLGSHGKKRNYISRPDRNDKHHSHKTLSGHHHRTYQEGHEEFSSRDGDNHNRHHHQHKHTQQHQHHHHHQQQQQSNHHHLHQKHRHEIQNQHDHHQHGHHDKQTQHHHNLHRKHQQHNHAHLHVHRKSHKENKENDEENEENEPRSKITHAKHNRKQGHNNVHKTQKGVHNAETKNVKHLHHILDYKHYVRYKKHHSVDEEVHGEWKGIKKKIKTCIKMKTFSASGKVLLTRARYQGKYMYTVLVCNVVRIRKHNKHRTRASYKKTQLCYKLYFVTRAVLQLKRTKESITGASEYDVDACRPSKASFHSVSFRGTLVKDQGKITREQLHRDQISKAKKKHGHKKKAKTREHTRKRARNKSKKKTKTTKAHGHTKKGGHKKHTVQGKSHKGKEQSKGGTSNEDVFFNKLLNVLSIVNKNKASANKTTPLSNLKSALQKMKKEKEEAQRKREKSHRKSSKKDARKHLKKSKEVDVSSPSYISKLLSKILPAVVSNVKSEIEGEHGVKKIHPDATVMKSTITTRKPATLSTTPSTTTHITTPSTTTPPPTTPTTKRTPKPTTKSKGIEDELKDILPFLLKKMQTTTTKPTPPKPTTQAKGKLIKDLLSRLGLTGLNLGAASKPTKAVKDDGNPSASRASIEEKMEDLSLPAAKPPPPHPPSILGNDPFSKHVLCFGDSLTNGYYNHGHNYHPYSIRFKQLLNSNHQIRYDVVTSGKTGEMAHGSMSKRLSEVMGNSSRFDWVVILAGTNDVAHVKNFGDDDSFMHQLISIWSPKIFKDIVTLHEDAYRYGSRTVLLTIPESAYEAWPQFKVLWLMRRKINQELRQFAASSQGRTVLCDLAVQIPRHSLSPQMQKLYWNDHLHLNPYGYDKMGEVVYQCLKPYL